VGFWWWTSVGGGDFDPVTMREVLQNWSLRPHSGVLTLWYPRLLPPGTIYGVADPEFRRVMPIRQDIEVLPADEPKQLKLGWVVSESFGIAIVNPRGCAAGRKFSSNRRLISLH